jgi:hypothetical protein
MTQSVAITCAQIATIPKNNASEASVATSSTTARPMSLTPIEYPKIHEFALVAAGNGKVQFARRTPGLSLTYLIISNFTM